MLLLFNVFPLVLLTLYPFKCFQRLLDFCLSQKSRLVVQIYMDSFTATIWGHYTWLSPLCYTLPGSEISESSNGICTLTTLSIFQLLHSCYIVFALALVAKFQPYKSKRNNTVDIILLLAIISALISSSMHYAETFMYPRLLNALIVAIIIIIIFLFWLFLATWCSLSWLVFSLRLYSAARSVNNLNQDDVWSEWRRY